MYRVVKYFTDIQDGGHPYNVGDAFPRAGLEVADERLSELAGSGNRQGVPLIMHVPDGEAFGKPEKKKPSRKRTGNKKQVVD